MKIDFSNFKLKSDFDKLHVIHWAIFSIILLTVVMKFFMGIIGWEFLFYIVFLAVYYRLYFRTIKELYYTFWTLTGLVLFYLTYNAFQALFKFDSNALFYFYLLAIILLFIEAYILSSPIYYPRVSWWEYDFRYRHDLKVRCHFKDEIYRARLNDLRREAGCLSAFEEIPVGSEVVVFLDSSDIDVCLKAEVMSSRIYSRGRPYNYGVKFLFDDENDRKTYNKLAEIYKNERTNKVKMKFGKDNAKV